MPRPIIESLESRRFLAASPLPDLTIDIASTSLIHVQQGVRTGMSVTVNNVGDALAAGTVVIHLAANGTPLGDQAVKLHIQPHRFKSFKVYYKVPDPGGPGVVTGYVNLTATVDTGNAIAEQDESNNSWQVDNVPLWNRAFLKFWNKWNNRPHGDGWSSNWGFW